ncbi:MAG: Erythromycin esterase [Chloroflexi bacterium]|nr:Erythromycin esterase [Chloroflexota bacterium]
MADRIFRDRREAGRVLAELLQHHRGRGRLLVLALPRGGVPVAYEVASSLDAPLDVMLVRKLGVPGQEELAMGAISSGGVVDINDDVVRGLRIPPEVIERVAELEGRELSRREEAYREGRPAPEVAGRRVILVDDGLATGSSMRAAILALRQRGPAAIVVAVPVAPISTCQELASMVDDVVCATTPSPFLAVGESYWNFTQTSDDEVRDLLRAATAGRWAPAAAPASEADALRPELSVVTEQGRHRDTLLDLVGDAHFVLIGEASHGTHEFYEERALLTRRLIEERGFCAVAVEADWPDAYRVNRFVRGRSDDATAEEALRGFQRFPTWMWRNAVVLDFVGWLREHNHRVLGHSEKAVFYGLDLYGTHHARQEVITYLRSVDAAAATRARERYACFDHLGSGDGSAYGFKPACGAGEACENEVVERLVDLRRHAMESARREGLLAEDQLFYAELNAAALKEADEHYRSMFGGRISAWNLRDRHMADTLDAIAEHLGRSRGRPAKIVVWAHNAHVGDARATEAACRGEINLGRLVRERHGTDCRLIGLTTYTGTVTAADHWGGPAERKWLRPALSDSVEELFHEVGEKAFFTSFSKAPRSADVLRSARLERMVAVVYRPQSERRSHYFRARLRDQFDAVIHVDETRAVEPLERTARWSHGEVPETYPSGV